MIVRILFIIAVLAFSGCATVNVPNVGESGYIRESDEIRLANRADEYSKLIDESGTLYRDVLLEDYLNAVAKRLLPEDLRVQKITIKILNAPSLNAFALPNGDIYVNTGIIAAAENESQIATLLAHEMTHILHRHALRSSRSVKNKSAFWMNMSIPLAVVGGPIGSVGGSLAMISSVSGYSREMESDADETGFKMTLLSGYCPVETVKMFQSLDLYIQDEKEPQPFFFSTHPNIKSRIDNYNALIASSSLDAVCSNGSVDFLKLVNELAMSNLKFCLSQGLFKTSERYAEKYIQRYPEDANGYYLRGEVFRQRQDPLKGKKIRDKAGDRIIALEAYEKALMIDPGLHGALKGKAEMLFKLGKKNEASVWYKKFLTLDPTAFDRQYIEQRIHEGESL